MAITILLIRLKQLLRLLTGVGLLRLIVLTAIVAYVGFMVWIYSSQPDTSLFVSVAFIALMAFIQLKRSDRLFLKTHFVQYKYLLLAEYTLLAVPVIVFLIIHQQWPALLPFTAIAGIIHIDTSIQFLGFNTRLHQLIPDDAFEWKAGMRKQFLIIAPLWIIGLLGSFYVGTVPIVLFIIAIITNSFYERCEPLSILHIYELNPKRLIALKMKRQIQLYLTLAVPLAIAFIIFHTQYWYILIAELVLLIFLQIYIIANKYAFYEENQKSVAAQTFGGIGILCIVIPVLTPALWVLTIWFYFKSIKKLNFYLDDYN
nr:hypothetical protein [uncultured Carboxylicivirga sp.]